MLGGFPSNDLLRVLIFTKPKEDGLAQSLITRLFGEFDLADHAVSPSDRASSPKR
jgi:hypothetical protein